MGIEPITRGLKDRYSSQLSYEVIFKMMREYKDSNLSVTVLETIRHNLRLLPFVFL